MLPSTASSNYHNIEVFRWLSIAFNIHCHHPFDSIPEQSRASQLSASPLSTRLYQSDHGTQHQQPAHQSTHTSTLLTTRQCTTSNRHLDGRTLPHAPLSLYCTLFKRPTNSPSNNPAPSPLSHLPTPTRYNLPRSSSACTIKVQTVPKRSHTTAQHRSHELQARKQNTTASTHRHPSKCATLQAVRHQLHASTLPHHLFRCSTRRCDQEDQDRYGEDGAV